MKKKELRRRLFIHLDGLVMVPISHCLYQNGVLECISEKETVSLNELAKRKSANDGYLNVALRCMASQGYLEYRDEGDDIAYALTDKGRRYVQYVPQFEKIIPLLEFNSIAQNRVFSKAHFEFLETAFALFKENMGLPEAKNEEEQKVIKNTLAQVEGFLAGPLLVQLGMKGMFHKYFMEKSFRAAEFHLEKGFKSILNFFAGLGWFKEHNGNFQFTDAGLFYAKRATAYGVTVSYSPLFNNLENRIFGSRKSIGSQHRQGIESHVDRAMNVWGSGGAHSNYFKYLDEVIIEIFNRPISMQPKGILDMGCGNGAFLIHLFDIIEHKTRRGEVLDEHPLFLVGVDYNETALQITRENLIHADIWAKVIWGDISNPEQLVNDLSENYDISLSNLLNVRTFLDHNRVWEAPSTVHLSESQSTGAFASKGKRLKNEDVESNLVEHLQKWKPYIEKFGLLTIELHTISPVLAAKNIGKATATAYDATHGFSDQYIVELDVFLQACREAGLNSQEEAFVKIPDSDTATVSIHLLK